MTVFRALLITQDNLPTTRFLIISAKILFPNKVTFTGFRDQVCLVYYIVQSTTSVVNGFFVTATIELNGSSRDR